MSHLKVHHCVSRDFTSLAWVTPLFEFYGVAGPGTRREALAQSANRVIQWVRREEERVFIIGGAVSQNILRWTGAPNRSYADILNRYSKETRVVAKREEPNL